MSKKLYEAFYKIHELLKELSNSLPINNNPHMYILVPLIKEQLTLSRTILILLQQEQSKKSLRQAIAIIYRSNEAFDPTLRADIGDQIEVPLSTVTVSIPPYMPYRNIEKLPHFKQSYINLESKNNE